MKTKLIKIKLLATKIEVRSMTPPYTKHLTTLVIGSPGQDFLFRQISDVVRLHRGYWCTQHTTIHRLISKRKKICRSKTPTIKKKFKVASMKNHTFQEVVGTITKHRGIDPKTHTPTIWYTKLITINGKQKRVLV